MVRLTEGDSVQRRLFFHSAQLYPHGSYQALRESWAVRYDIKVSLTDVILKSKFSFYVIGQKDWGVCMSHLAHNLVVVVDRRTTGMYWRIRFLSSICQAHASHMWIPTIIFDMWIKLYKLLKNVVNINTEKKPGYLWKALCVSIHHGTILEIENSKTIILQLMGKKK